jgi:hypothetical protein
MKKVYLLIPFIFICLSGYGQNKHLKVHSGFDIGYSHKGFIPLTVYLGSKETQYGLTIGLPVKTGTKGKYHPVINWSEFPKEEDVIKEGEYYLPIMFNLSRAIHNNLYLGGGIGYTFKTLYRNMHDDSEIIGDNGSYYITSPGKGRIDYIMFLNYVFPSIDSSHFSIRVFYSGLMGVGASIGYAF